MGYNRQETGTLTAADGDLYIFSSATDSSYDPAPDYRDLTVSGAGQTYTELTVSDGGIVRVGTGAIWNGGAVYAGGSAVVSARGKLQNVTIASEGTISGANVNAARTATTLYSAVTVQSGGKLQVNGQWNELDNLVVNSGGRIELGAGFTNYVFAGSDTYIASGTWFKNGGAATDLAVVNGVVTGFGTIGAVIAYVSNGITIDGGNTNHWLYVCGGGTVKNVTVANGNMVVSNGGVASSIIVGTNGKYLYVSQGGIVRGVTVTTANGYLRMNSAAVSGADVRDNGNLWLKAGLLYNANVTGGAVYINGSGGNISLGGAETVISRGTIWYNHGDTKTDAVNDAALAVADGKITGLVMKNSGLAGMNNLTILDGLSAIAPTLSSGAMLYVSNGAAVRGGILNDAKIYVSNGGCISGVVISAGSAELYDATAMTGIERAAIVAEDLTLSAGRMILRGSNASGRDFTVYGGTLYIQNGAVIDTVHAKGGAVALAYNATVDGNATTLTAKNLNISAGASLAVNGSAGRDTTISGLNLEGSASGTIVGARVHSANLSTGAVLYVSSGAQIYEAVASNGSMFVSNGGCISGVVISAGSAELYDAAAKTGVERADIVAENLTLSAGRTILRGSNASGRDFTVYGGTLYIQNGAVIDTVHAKGGAVALAYNATVDGNATTLTAKNLNISAGAAMTVLGSAGRNTLISGLSVEEGAVSPVVSYATIHFISGNAAHGVTLKNVVGYVSSGAQVYGAIMSNTSMFVSNGGCISGVVISAGSAELYDATAMTGVERADIVAGNLTLSAGRTILRGSNASGRDFTVYGGTLYIQNGAVIDTVHAKGGKVDLAYNATVDGNATTLTAKNLNISAGAQLVVTGVAGKNTVVSGLNVAAGATANFTQATVELQNGNVANKLNAGTGAAINVGSGARLVDAHIGSGARINIVKDGDGATLTGANTDIADGTLYFNGTAVAGRAANGVLTGFNATDLFKLSIGDGIVVSNVSFNNGEIRISAFGGASVDTATVNAGAIVCNVGANGTFDNVTLVGTGILNLSGTAVAHNTVVSAGGQFALNQATVLAENTTIKAGAKFKLNAVGADTGELLTVDFTEGGNSVYIDNLDRIASSTSVVVKGLNVGSTYTLTTSGAATTGYVCCDAAGLYDNKVQGGTTYTNAFAGKTWNFSTGKSIAVTEFNIGEAKTTAGTITTADTALNTNDRAAKWDTTTSYTDSVTLANASLSGDAWLEIDGTNVSTALYGASGNYAHTVNIEAKAGEIRNLAAGAANGGSVAGVKLTLDGADVTGAAYAGGFGTVTGKTETLISDGSFSKDFYAGALANYKSTGVQTTVGDIAMTIEGGTFSGNIYGASAVKSSVAGAHTAGDVTLTITDGSTTKGTQACIFSGGYATGDATATVYSVDSVTAEISGGNWGTACGGRGVFGGIMASGVEAKVLGDVNLTVSGGAMGNVYGGGWAQKQGGRSIVGDVEITITGTAQVANVFGGGSHSTSGGTTSAENVSITVSGGTISGAIYAKGQLDGDSVTGDATVTFTGGSDFTCGVYGYSYVGAMEASDATLTFAGYTGEFSGAIGGFSSIEFSAGTAMTLTTAAADVSNTAWKFDVSARDAALAGTAMLDWNAADFTGDTIALNLTTGSTTEWTLVDAATDTNYHQFDVLVDGVSQGVIALDEQIASGDYAGWGFTREDSALKFRNLA